ncbi:MAG TPA: Gfo/Idh/MocA family oxidoreductase [Armatimonadota bacterium]|nr:Gfo/Idh/MocA family oxidoreductase [Armatimonadota bacterium]
MARLGIGIIGSGGIARNAHMPGYKTMEGEGVRILAVADANPDVAREAAEQFDVPHRFTDYRELLAMDEIQAVSICTPNYLHMQPTIDALEAGKHVLVEKPLAMNAAEGKAMVDAAHRTGKKLQVGFMKRFEAGAQALKRFVDAGEMGEIYFARAQAMRRRGIPGWGVFTQKDKQGGGPLIDIGVHILDLTLWLMGHPKPLLCSGQTYAKFGHREGLVGLLGQWDPKIFTVEDFAVGLVRFDNGATLVLESAFVANQELRDLMQTDLFGTEGGCSFNPPKMFFERHKTLIDATPAYLPQVNAHHEEVRAFCRAILDDTPVPVTGEQALMTTQIIDAIYRSSELGREVPVE